MTKARIRPNLQEVRTGQEKTLLLRTEKAARGSGGGKNNGSRKRNNRKNIKEKVILLLAAIGVLLTILLYALGSEQHSSRSEVMQRPEPGRGSTAVPDDPSAPGAMSAVTAESGSEIPPSPDQSLPAGQISSGGAAGQNTVPAAAAGTSSAAPRSGSGSGNTAAGSAVTVARTIPSPKKTRISIIIDDVGYNLQQLAPFLKFPGPLTFAVLPGLAHTEESLAAIEKAGKQAILHFPMEAVGGADPGPGALYTYMTDDEVRSVISINLAQVRDVRGINNHQGSAITVNKRIMSILFGELAARNLFFLDSMTTSDSLGRQLAADYNLKFLKRDVFLDNEKSEAAIRAAFEGGLAASAGRGTIVMIGHVSSSRLPGVLEDLYAARGEKNIEFSYPEALLPSVSGTSTHE